MQGKIIKGIAGFYYVHTLEHGVFQCKAKGIFRKEKQKPLVGDDVEIDVLSIAEMEGNIVSILPRKNQLIRPAVANIDQALVIFALTSPKPNFHLLDCFLVAMEQQQVETVVCFNKGDLATEEELNEVKRRYQKCGCRLIFASARMAQGREALHSVLWHKTTTVAGPSGVGKSSLINLLQSSVEMETGEISDKIGRGKHTTRHSQLIWMGEDTYIVDTPGFSSLYVDGFPKEELKQYFPEFAFYADGCRFLGCSHISEPDCCVKEAVAQGEIHPGRYENYISIYNEIKEKKRY